MSLKYIYLFLPLFAISSCDEPAEDESTNNSKEKKEAVESIAKRYVESKLEINPAEKYSLNIYKAQMDGDNYEDAIVAVNRYNFAVEKSLKSKNPGKVAEIGYMGPYNYIFYYDGASGTMTGPTEIPSTPIAPLKISFEKVMSDAYSDVVVSFRIRNSCFKHIYSIQNKKPRLVFGWKIFDGFGTPDSEACHLVFETKAVSLPKDIRVMKARILPSNQNQNYTILKNLCADHKICHRTPSLL